MDEVNEVARIWRELDYCTGLRMEGEEDRQGFRPIDDVVSQGSSHGHNLRAGTQSEIQPATHEPSILKNSVRHEVGFMLCEQCANSSSGGR